MVEFICLVPTRMPGRVTAGDSGLLLCPLPVVRVSVSVFVALSTVFHSINSPNNSPFSHFVLLSHSALLVLSTLCLFMNVSFSPRVHLHARGGDVVFYAFDINQPSLPTPFYSALVSISVLWSFQLYFIHDNSPLSRSVLPVLSLPYSSFQLYISS